MPLTRGLLDRVLAPLAAGNVARDALALAQHIVTGDPPAGVRDVVGTADERKPLVVEGAWLYPQRMHALERSFTTRLLERLTRPAEVDVDERAIASAIDAVALSPFALSEEQRRAVGLALSSRLAIVSGGPGTGKTSIVLAILRALMRVGYAPESIALAAPTGRAANRIQEAIARAFDISARPKPQTLHRLLGWSPSADRFLHHENNRLAARVVVLDEGSMIDLELMERLVRSLRDDARLVLLGDADQLPSVEAGAVFRDLVTACERGEGARRAVRLVESHRVDPSEAAGGAILAAARHVNAGWNEPLFARAFPMATRATARELTFEGVEHLAGAWSEHRDAFVERWFLDRVASLDRFARRIARTYRMRDRA
jgi:exodeoxyribonuclease V alpha subunit